MHVMSAVLEYLKRKGTGKKVSLRMVVKGVRMPRKPVLRVLAKLEAEGWLEYLGERPSKKQNVINTSGPELRSPVWLIKRDVVKRRVKTPKKRTGADRLWQVIRAKRRFTRKDLRRMTGINENYIGVYTRKLEAYEFIRQTGKDGPQKVYMLINDVGPNRPDFTRIPTC